MPGLSPLLRAFVLALGAAAVASPGAPGPTTHRHATTIPLPPPIGPAPAADTTTPLDLGPEIGAFYHARGFRPVWVEDGALGPAAQALLADLPADAARDAAIRAAENGDARALTRADLLLTKAYVDRFAAEPAAQSHMHYIDPGLAPRPRAAPELLAALARGPASAIRRNPAYDGLVRGLALYHARWGGLPQDQVAPGAIATLRHRLGLEQGGDDATLAARLREFQSVHGLPMSGRPDPATITALNRGAAWYEAAIRRNIDRARAIPAAPGRRYVLVDTGSARLFMVEDGRIMGSMRVIVGKPAMQTPEMAGLIRYAVLNPYWNVPPDLIRKRAAGAVRRGPGAITGERLQVLNDWSPGAHTLAANSVDWHAVAAGHRLVQVRQLPGPDNMMGRIKFMLPNDLGVYLHDTPLRHLFAGADRRQSSGCVRLEDAMGLGRWLFRGAVPTPSGAPEQRVDLPEAVPVYITYLTALPSRAGVVFRPDAYHRDGAATPTHPTHVAAAHGSASNRRHAGRA